MMNTEELNALIERIAANLDIPADSPELCERILDRIGNLRHQARHVQVLSHCLEKNRALNAENAELQAALQQTAQLPSRNAQAHPLFHIFNSCVQRARLGEVAVVRGSQPSFWRQPWTELADSYGANFLYAQAMQKLREAQLAGLSDCAGIKRLEAINHIAMGLLHERRQLPTREAI